MKNHGPLLPIYLFLNLFFPLLYLGYTLAIEHPDYVALVFFLAILPTYSIYGTFLMLELFPMDRSDQLREFAPFLIIVAINGFVFGAEILSTFLVSATVLFLMMTVIFFFGIMKLMMEKMHKDTIKTKATKWLVFVLIFTAPILLSGVIYMTGYEALLSEYKTELAHGILIIQIAASILLNTKVFTGLHKRGSL